MRQLKIFFIALLGLCASLYSSVGPATARAAYRGLYTPTINANQRRLMSNQINEKLLERLKTSIAQKDTATADQTLKFIKATRPNLLSQAEGIYADKQAFTQQSYQQSYRPEAAWPNQTKKTAENIYTWPSNESEDKYSSIFRSGETIGAEYSDISPGLAAYYRAERDKAAKTVGEFLEQNWHMLDEAWDLKTLLVLNQHYYFDEFDAASQKRMQDFHAFAQKAYPFLRNNLHNFKRRPQLKDDTEYFMSRIRHTDLALEKLLSPNRQSRPKSEQSWSEKVADWFKSKQR